MCPVCLIGFGGAGDGVTLRCSHGYHRECLAAQVAAGDSGTGLINFRHLECALCRADIALCAGENADAATTSALQAGFESRGALCRSAVAKLHELGMAPECACGAGECKLKSVGRCPTISADALSAVAMSKLAFYRCAKCRCAYWGGLRNCEVDSDPADSAPPVCPSCEALPAGFEVCATHGRDGILWKCLWCCRPGQLSGTADAHPWLSFTRPPTVLAAATHICRGGRNYCESSRSGQSENSTSIRTLSLPFRARLRGVPCNLCRKRGASRHGARLAPDSEKRSDAMVPR